MIEDFVELCKEKFKRTYEVGGKKWHVKALCYCRYKVLNEPYEVVASKPIVMIGQIVHYAVERLCQYEAKTYFKKILDYEVYGTPDLVLGNNVVEVKYTMYPPENPRPHDVLQLKLYLWLLDKEIGYLWYLSNNEFKEFEVINTLSDDDVVSLIEKPKYPFWEWECKYCSLVNECPYRVRL